jgi:hypothetical protein
VSVVDQAIADAEMLHALRQKVRELTNDCEAQRKALERVTAERDHWRHAHGDLTARIVALIESLSRVTEARHD